MTDTGDEGPGAGGRPGQTDARSTRRLLWDTDVSPPAADDSGPARVVLPPAPDPGPPPPWPGQLVSALPPAVAPAPPPRSGPPVAALAAIAAIVLLAVATVVIVGVRGDGGEAAAGSTAQPSGIGLDTGVVDPATADPTFDPTTAEPTTAEPTTPEPTTDAPTPEPGEPGSGYRIIPGPAGIQVPIPDTWSVHAGAVDSNLQADDLATSGRFLRFGGDRLEVADTLAAVRLQEKKTPTIRTGYRRIRLAEVAAGPTGQAVDWEFTFSKDGGTRHAYGRYWLQNGTVYVVYLSSAESDWVTGTDILTTVMNGVTVS